MKKYQNGLGWIIGIMFILMGVLSVGEYGIIASVFVGLLGLWIIPLTRKKFREVCPSLKGWQSIIVGVALFGAWGISLPTVETTSDELATEIVETESAYIEEVTTESIKEKEENTEKIETLTIKDDVDLGQMKVHFLDVGQGLSILVQANDKVLLYDGGDSNTSSYVVAYLKENSVSQIDYLISSHYDSDHVYGLIGCLNAFEVKNVISSDYEHDSDVYDKFVAAVENEGLEIQHPKVGTEISLGSANFTILAPEKINKSDSNTNSVVIRLVHGEKSFLFTGDATFESESNIVNLDTSLDCDVLSLGHHGAALSTSWEFLEKIVPEYAVLSCGKNNQYGHPDEDVMEKLESMEIELFRTDKQGEIVASSDGIEIIWNVSPCNDYSSGVLEEVKVDKETEAQKVDEVIIVEESTKAEENIIAEIQTEQQTTLDNSSGGMVWLSATGEKYHSINNCGRMNPAKARQVTLDYALGNGYQACSKCH